MSQHCTVIGSDRIIAICWQKRTRNFEFKYFTRVIPLMAATPSLLVDLVNVRFIHSFSCLTYAPPCPIYVPCLRYGFNDIVLLSAKPSAAPAEVPRSGNEKKPPQCYWEMKPYPHPKRHLRGYPLKHYMILTNISNFCIFFFVKVAEKQRFPHQWHVSKRATFRQHSQMLCFFFSVT